LFLNFRKSTKNSDTVNDLVRHW